MLFRTQVSWLFISPNASFSHTDTVNGPIINIKHLQVNPAVHKTIELFPRNTGLSNHLGPQVLGKDDTLVMAFAISYSNKNLS